MTQCARCDTDNPEFFRFCGHCGAPLEVLICPTCGALVALATQQFCGQCAAGLRPGAPSAAPLGAMVEERKLATILFADVVGFTSLAERSDPEAVARLVDRTLGRLGQVVVDHGGTVDKYMGDAVMAVFGVPIAHDDDAERAVAAALVMRDLGGELTFSIGVNTGEVMATSLGRPGATTVIGDAVNIAARLERAAGPGEILCGPLTAQLTGGAISMRPRPPIPLKGKREPVEVWEALALSPFAVETAADQIALVGRRTELAFLAGQWAAVRDNREARVVLLCGDAGSGTTRLANELIGLASADGRVVRASYPAYGPIGGARVVAELTRQLGASRDPAVHARLRSVAGDLDPGLESLDAVALRREQKWAFGRLVREKTEEEPLLVVVDDMHRGADRPLEMAMELAARSEDLPLLLLLVGRSDPADWLGKFPDATTVRLRALSATDAAALAGAFVCGKPLTAPAADFLVERAGGNPLYLRELVSMARSQGSLVDEGDFFGLGDRSAIPPTLHALLAARLDGLAPGQKLVFEHLAVFGEGPTASEVEALGAPEVASALHGLVDSGLLRLRSDGRYSAVDSLLREVAYETLPRRERGELHLRASETVGPAEERARHLERAAQYLADDDALVVAAAEALADVGEELLAGLRSLDALPVMERAVAFGCRRPSVLLSLAGVQAQAGSNEDARRTLTLVADDPLDPTVAVERDHSMASTAIFEDPAAAIAGLGDAARRWHALGRTSKEAWAVANAGVALFNLSRMGESAEQLDLAITLFDRAGDRSGRVAASSFLCLARPTDERVAGWLTDALEFAGASGDRSMQSTTLITLTWHHFLQSFWGGPPDVADAQRFAEQLTSLSEELGARDLAVQGWSLLALMARNTGRFDDAARYVGEIERLGAGGLRGEPWLGWAAGFTVMVAAGTRGAAPPFPPGTSPDPVISIAGLIVAAELTLAGRVDEALVRFDDTLHHDQRPIDHLTSILHAVALSSAGRPAEARPWAARAANVARSLGARHVLRAAEAIMADIDHDPGAAEPPPEVASGIADALVLRTHAAGDPVAARALAGAIAGLSLPGLKPYSG